MEYIELMHTKELYNNTPQETIKPNIKRLMNSNKVKYSKVSEILNISQHTAYSYTNEANHNKPILINIMIIASYFDISVNELLKA